MILIKKQNVLYYGCYFIKFASITLMSIELKMYGINFIIMHNIHLLKF